MRIRKGAIGVLLVLGLVALASGCAKKESAPGAGPSEQARAPEIELKYNDWSPPGIYISQLAQEAAKRIEERTGGRVKVTCYFSETLLKFGDAYKGTAAGTADISQYSLGVTPGVHQLNWVFALPIVGLPDLATTHQIYRELLARYPELQAECEKTGTRWLNLRPLPATQIHTTKAKVVTPADLKGKKLITLAGHATGWLVNSLGGAAVEVGPGDWYTSLERGLAEGLVVHWAAVHDFKLTELFKYHTHIGPGGLGMPGQGFIVNLKTWNSLPRDVQEIILEAYNWVHDEAVKYDQDLITKAAKEAQQAGHEVIELTPDQLQEWAQAVQPYIDKWIADTEAKGLPARRVYEGLQELIKQHQQAR